MANKIQSKQGTRHKLEYIYQRLYAHFGPQAWWPADSPFEVIVGAILTQNTNWQNVARAINNLKEAGVLKEKRLYHLSEKSLAKLIRPSGYYNIKARRLKSFLDFLFKRYDGSLNKMFSNNLQSLRQEILAVRGVGPETADSILLYAAGLPIFVVDSYTKRILSRHKIISEDSSYEEVQKIFMRNLEKDVRLYNEYHALIVRLGKDICRKNNPRCQICPLK